MRYRFGQAELRTRSRELAIRGVITPLGGRAFDLLQVLIERRDRVVSAREIFSLVWPGLAVQPNNLQVQIWALRGLLGFDSIATVARRGYRFIAQVDALLDEGPLPGHDAPGGAQPLDRSRSDPWSIEAAAVCAELGAHRLVTLIGPDDASRRGLAMSVARHLSSHLRGGTWFVDAAALAVADGRPAADLERFMRRLAMRDALVVLLDAHRAVKQVRQLADVLPLPPRTQVLATARDALRLPGERVLQAPRRPESAALPSATTVSAGLRWRGRAG